MKKKLVMILCAAVTTTMLLSACSSKTNEGSSSDSSQADSLQVLSIGGFDYSTLDVSIGSDSESATSAQNVFEGLYREIDENGVQKQVPAIAESMDKSSDGTVYTFHLRKDAKWSDEKPITAGDFVYSWTRLIDPKTASPYSDFLDMIKGAEEFREGKGSAEALGLKAIDDNTFEVTLKEPTAYFEKILSFNNLAPIRKDIVEAQGDKYGTDFSKMLYNGPFVISDYQKGSKIIYKKNENYWDKDNVKLTEVDGSIYTESAVGMKMFQNKEIDVIGSAGPKAVTGDDLKVLEDAANAGTYDKLSGYGPSVYYNIFNTENPVLKNVKVRQAISIAIDRQEFLDVIYKRFVPAEGIVSKAVTLDGKEYRDQVEEPLKAFADANKDPKALLEEGLKEENIDVSSSKLTMLFGPKTARSQMTGEYFQKLLKDKLGLTLELKYSPDSPSYFKDRNDGKFDICIGGWSADYDDVSSFYQLYTTGNGNNSGKYSNAKYDELVTQASHEQDQGKRVELYKEAEKIVTVDDPAVAPLYYQDVHTFLQPYVKGYYVPHFNGYYDLKPIYISGK